MIQFEHVTKKFGGVTALKDVSLNFGKGKIIGVLGANGSGKSTFLKLIAGLVSPTAGNVLVDGEKVTRKISRKVAYLSELDVYYDSFTVQDMLEFYASQFSDFRTEKARDILAFMQMDPSKKLKQLSKGGRGRAKIAFTLAREAPILLMDEPLSGLDPMVRESIVKGLVSFIDLERQMIVMTTHEIDEVEPLLDEAVFLRDGMVAERVHVDELRETNRDSVASRLKKMDKGEE
ncbi:MULTISPECIES: ATP-binding cassette domain-containing protein [Bacillota]|mgnify:CR=1 FL=1|uniref:ABC transporter ATP-binding protein n=1 Tax=Symbiobacterium thermophilum TaxID=2734 RepID=A0A953LL39_SYMTR|nr:MULTISPECIES: ABC transporter ATP-binding protein [Bacillota]MBY6277732.1 ABC transporter ATP-binding protein [Symbiobacterium thermophilum]OUM83982.1 MAG: spermidine/putrescine ABC transporter ATP-binding protein [Parageobacillus thermoglucosidasius]